MDAMPDKKLGAYEVTIFVVQLAGCSSYFTYIFFGRNSTTYIPQAILSIPQKYLANLCNPTRGDSHFRGHVSPIFCDISPFVFVLNRPPTLSSNSVFDYDLVVCVHPPTVYS